ncbi:MAG: adenylate/guanylate cyclase domain-containing protein [Terrimesophilobacter sp.]
MSHATRSEPSLTHSLARTSSGRAGLSIQSSLLIMLLVVSLLSSIVVGLIGYVNGSDSLRAAAFDRLVGVRDSRAQQVTELFGRIKSSVVVQSRNGETVDAIGDFARAFAELQDVVLTPDEVEEIEAYYRGPFATQREEATGAALDTASFIPDTVAQRFLQLHYTIPRETAGAETSTTEPGDGMTWAIANAKYDQQFRRMAGVLDFEDILLIDTRGNVIYSANKGVDLGTNLLTGPYGFSNLSTAYKKVLSTNNLDAVEFTDFGEYPPSIDRPAAWAVSPVGANGQALGVIAVEISVDAINSLTTGDMSWSVRGMGETGETYLVGADHLMRSTSRALVENSPSYLRQTVSTGTNPALAQRIVDSKSTLLLQSVNTVAVERALRGDTGTVIGDNYLGKESLAAFTPAGIDNLDWVIVAEISTDEAFAPVREFTRNLVLSSAALLILVAVLSLVLAQSVVRPLRRLKMAAGRIAAGEMGVEVDAGRSDELADVATAFNDMSRSLQVKAELLDEQVVENERLLLTLMPPALAKRYRDGDQNIAQDHGEVTVLYADILGFDEYSRGMESELALSQLNDILKSFDEAAETHGVERVRTNRSGYLASCGLTIPRVDNAQRTIDVALEMQRILERFGAQFGATLNLRAGIDTGTVTSGLVGRSHVVYDMWGDAVSLAFQVQGETAEAGIFITQRVLERLPGTQNMVAFGSLQTSSGEQRVWRMSPPEHHG